MTRHRTDLVSLVPGLAFVALAVAAWSGAVRLDAVLDLRWVWPTLLIAGGVLLLAGITRRAEEPTDAPGDGPADAPVDEPSDAGWEPSGADG